MEFEVADDRRRVFKACSIRRSITVEWSSSNRIKCCHNGGWIINFATWHAAGQEIRAELGQNSAWIYGVYIGLPNRLGENHGESAMANAAT